MMGARQLGKTVTEAMQEACPDRLMHLTLAGQLPTFLDKRIQAFKLQFVREMEGKPYPQAELTVIDSLMPMLIEFQPEKNPRELTTRELNQVEEALDQYEELAVSNNYRESTSEEISD
jgi:hypothetical protein